jgi:predicted metal-dependent phosphoesterase TrpH
MLPKISNSSGWQQAEILMQPAFIRIIDNLRKQLDVSSWKGTYQDVVVWASDISDETKTLVMRLLTEMETATSERSAEIRDILAKLPVPHPGYHLCLQRQDQQVVIDLWDLCYQLCFHDYVPGNEFIDIDTSLIDETGEVDWNLLDQKAKNLVEEMFAKLPDADSLSE